MPSLGNCDANRLVWVALVQLINGNALMTSEEVLGIRIAYYSTINAWLRKQNTPVGADQAVGGAALDCVEYYCLNNSLPDLTALVVRKDPKPIPGDGFFIANGIDHLDADQRQAQWLAMVRRVYQQKARYSIQSPADLCQHGNCS